MSTPESYSQARKLIDEVHSRDPASLELGYADAMESWTLKLQPTASPSLLLAARCQHLDRFSTPRSSYPEGKAGYLKWRRDLYTTQSLAAHSILLSSGVSPSEADSVRRYVSKENLSLKNSSDPAKREQVEEGTQVLEDAAVLVFLERELLGFVGGNEGWEREKWVDIMRKTWKKLSPEGQAAAMTIVPSLPKELQEILVEAVTSSA